MGLKIFCIIVCAVQAVTAVIRPSTSLYIVNNEGFIAYLETSKSFGAHVNCWFKYRDDAKYAIDLNSSEPIITDRDETILPFSPTICGIRANKLSSASAAIWTLEVENAHQEYETGKLTIQILPGPKTKFETHVQREMGRSTIACTKHESYTKHCKIIDNDTGESWNKCDVETSIHPNKTLQCLTYNWGSLMESEEHIVVDIKNASSQFTTASLEDTEQHYVLRCQFQETIRSCQAEMPDHQHEIYIMDGLYNGRYSSFDTLTSKSKCSLEIPKPLSKSEVGLWKIINYDSSTPSGCLFYIGTNKSDIIEKELEHLVTMKTMQAYEPNDQSNNNIPEISCSVPFPIDDCYLRDPNQTVYFPESYKFQRYRQYGKCSFSNLPVIAGTWVCGARGRDYPKEVLQNIELIVKPKKGEIVTQNVKAKAGSAIELMCKSAFSEPISHCAFIDPHGKVYLVGTQHSVKTLGHVKYYGSGIHRGECGIQITEVRPGDYGQWKCQFVIFSGKLPSEFIMTLSETVIGHATSIGLGVGLSVVTVLVFGVVIGTVFYRKRQLRARHDFPSSDPLHSAPTSTATTPT